MAQRIWCFSTPTEEAALAHKKNFYGWMLAGRDLFKALSREWPLFDGSPCDEPRVLETFPHAVVCALAGRIVAAKPKAQVRRAALIKQGVDVSELTNVDYLDAALCAVTAQAYLRDEMTALGDTETGFMVVPRSPLLAASVSHPGSAASTASTLAS
jgi:predicted RNase H-like nuclease